VQFASSSVAIQQYLAGRDRRPLLAFLEGLRKDEGFDFLGLTGPNGEVLLRTSQLGRTGDNASSISLVGAALAGKVAAATELLSAGQIANEDPALRERARLRTDTGEATAGLALMAAAPVEAASGNRLGVLHSLNPDTECFPE
jgi:hypothetical protein